MLAGSITFAPAAAPLGTPVAFTATLTNQTDHWLFGPVMPPWGFDIYLYTQDTEDSNLIPRIVRGVSGNSPGFRHQTKDGVRTGLLLAPHASYSFSNHTSVTGWSWYTSDYVIHADIIFEPVGVADAAGAIARDAGSLTVIVPPPTTATDG